MLILQCRIWQHIFTEAFTCLHTKIITWYHFASFSAKCDCCINKNNFDFSLPADCIDVEPVEDREGKFVYDATAFLHSRNRSINFDR